MSIELVLIFSEATFYIVTRWFASGDVILSNWQLWCAISNIMRKEFEQHKINKKAYEENVCK